MASSVIDLRSDTVTRPTPAMWDAIRTAEVGDDVFGEDPTINRLQERVAALLGKEAALFVPSGTQSNQLCVKVHTQPGDEVLGETECHIFCNEAGAPAILSGVTCKSIEGTNGILELSQLEGKIKPADDHLVNTRLVVLENTHNHGGGKVYPLEKIDAISTWARSKGLAIHLDGARLWNAIVATGISAAEWAKRFDTVSVCFSKGLGAPIGSALAGSTEFVAKARKWRKIMGGGMRQAGMAAAAALYALDHHIDRLAEDHENAQIIANAIKEVSCLKLVPEKVDTNLVWFDVDPEFGSARHVADSLGRQGLRLLTFGPRTLRAVTHLDVSRAQANKAADIIVNTLATATWASLPR
ncbi:GntG family PLP-dependent aldolase [soil metagenome]